MALLLNCCTSFVSEKLLHCWIEVCHFRDGGHPDRMSWLGRALDEYWRIRCGSLPLRECEGVGPRICGSVRVWMPAVAGMTKAVGAKGVMQFMVWIPAVAGMTKAVRRSFANFCGEKRLDDSLLCAQKCAVCRRPLPDFHALCIGIVSLLSFVHFDFNFHNCA
jgi:hypothetical protein